MKLIGKAISENVLMNNMWRVSSTVDFLSDTIRHTRWFHSEDAALEYVEWCKKTGRKNIKMTRYREIDEKGTE